MLGLAPEAFTSLSWALEAEPENPEYHIYHAYAGYLVDPSKLEESLARIRENCDKLKAEYNGKTSFPAEVRDRIAVPYYFIGKIMISIEHYDEAMEALNMAAKLNPGDVDTQRNIRYVAMKLKKQKD